MESLPHSPQPNMLSKKSCNGTTTKSIYDDVFGGPPRFPTPTLSPRLEDYREIFGCFQASRASSIPVLDLPLVDEAADVFFGLRGSGYDYDEVFGGFNGYDFAVSYNELLMMEQSNGLVDDSSSEEAWAPAEAENRSDKLNHSAKDQCLLNGDSCDSTNCNVEFVASYNKVGQISNKDSPNRIAKTTQLSGYNFVVDRTSSLPKTDYKYNHMQERNSDHLNILYSGEMMSGRHLRKVMSHPVNGSNTDVLFFGDDVKHHGEFVKNGSLSNETFVTISDVSLRTQPSHLPPPSRLPPGLDVFGVDSGNPTTNFRYVASDETAGVGSPPYFEVEVDASSSAAASAAAMRDAMEKAQAKLKSAKESMERKRDGFQNRVKSVPKTDRKDQEEKLTMIVNGSASRKDEKGQGISQIEENGMDFSILKEMQKVKKTMLPISDSLEGKKNNVVKKSAEHNHGAESSSSQGSDGDGEWKEATQFFELVTNNSKKAFDQENNENFLVHNSIFHERGKKEKNSTMEALQRPQSNYKKVKAARRDHGSVEYEKKSEESKEAFEHDKSNGTSEVVNRQKVLDKKAQVCFRQEGNEKKLKMDQKPVETEKQQTRVDGLKKHENSVEVKQIENKIGAMQTVKHKEKGSHLKENVQWFTCENQGSERRDFELEENEKKINERLEQGDNERKLNEILEKEERENMIKAVHEREENEKIQIEANEREEKEQKLGETLRQEEKERILKETHEKEENLRRKREAAEWEESEKRQREVREREENEKRQREALEQEKKERLRRQREAVEWEENDKIQRQILEREENEKRQREVHEREENDKRIKEAQEKEENDKKLKETVEKEERQRRLREAVEREANKERLKETFEKEENERRIKVTVECEENESGQRKARGREENEKRCEHIFEKEEQEACEREVGKRLEKVHEKQACVTSRWTQEAERSETSLREACGAEEFTISQAASKWDETEAEHIGVGECGKKKVLNKMVEDLSVLNQAKLDDDKSLGATQLAGKNEGNSKKLEVTKEIANEETSKTMNELRNGEKQLASGIVQGDLQHEKSQFLMEDATDIEWKTIGKVRSNFGMDPDIGNQDKKFPCQNSEEGKNLEQTQLSVNPEINKVDIKSARAVKESVDNGRKREGAQSATWEVKVSTHRTVQHVNAAPTAERKVKNSYGATTSEDKETERTKREGELEREHLGKMEEERERGREREKDRMAVDRATLDNSERAYAEARERAEWAAVERATAEARQRALNEARERLEKACAEARERSLPDKASIEARLRAERAAVERAATVAPKHAFEKAMSDRAAFEAGEREERSMSDKLSASSRNSGMKASTSSSDLQDLQTQGAFSGSRYQYSSVYTERFEGVEGESVLRYKARLERNRRTAERAAKALAEKNMRDLLVQREQAERNRLAETLDADVKRWSSGKEGNLRALLSTLQYILGPSSGWQPIPLTEVITSAAVKKAYRKATLCVHPDKLQQRGASIQHKYICEKVFDLLKEAWNKFNSEER